MWLPMLRMLTQVGIEISYTSIFYCVIVYVLGACAQRVTIPAGGAIDAARMVMVMILFALPPLKDPPRFAVAV